jgi:hypothetical protein
MTATTPITASPRAARAAGAERAGLKTFLIFLQVVNTGARLLGPFVYLAG